MDKISRGNTRVNSNMAYVSPPVIALMMISFAWAGPCDTAVSQQCTLSCQQSLCAYPRMQKPVHIPLEGDANQRLWEYSGLGWYRDILILLPQFPQRSVYPYYRWGWNYNFPIVEEGLTFGIPKQQLIEHFRSNATVTPVKIPIDLSGIESTIIKQFDGNRVAFQGFESIAFQGDEAFLTMEYSHNDVTGSYLVRGHMTAQMELLLDYRTLRHLPAVKNSNNMGFEAIALTPNYEALALFELNGVVRNPNAMAYRIPLYGTLPNGTLPNGETNLQKIFMENIDFRITDMTELDHNNNFWVMNYHYIGDYQNLQPQSLFDYDLEKKFIERLVEFHYDRISGVRRTESQPVYFESGGISNNWEGLVRFNSSSFLIINDYHPKRIQLSLVRL